jgi:glutamate synthase (NADPH/NADH) large chain
MDEMIGHVEYIDAKAALDHWKASGLDLSPILSVPVNRYNQSLRMTVAQDHGLEAALDQQLIVAAKPAIESGQRVKLEFPIRNVNRTVGTMLGSEVTRRHGGKGLPDGTIDISFRGSAGQSFGAFVPAGITLRLEGDANDFLGKGLSGGRVILRPARESKLLAEENIIAGNVVAYGATSGEVYVRGIVGERFCVRNSGATAVVEGVGDHGCEYMTGGRVVVLGATGRNFGAGMSGGIAYVYDVDGFFGSRVNYEMVEIEHLDDEDKAFLQATVAKHLEYTGSAVATRLLDDWDGALLKFRKVMPQDYARVMRVMKEASVAGLDEAETFKRVMESAHG